MSAHVLIGGRVYEVPAWVPDDAYRGVGWPRRLWVEPAVRRFSLQFAMLLEEDISMPAALSLLRFQQRSRSWQVMLSHIEQRLQEGDSLSHALASHPRVFRPGYIYTVAWAEGQGDPSALNLALRLLGGESTLPARREVAVRDDEDLDVFARRLRNG